MKNLVVEICAGTSCYLRGSQKLFDAVEALPIEKREWIDLRGVACLMICRKGPSVRIDGTVFVDMTPGRLLALIDTKLGQEESGCAAGFDR